jgi:hypothetical protein
VKVRSHQRPRFPLMLKNPILTGLLCLIGFWLAIPRHRPEIIHFQSDADGQLSLLNFEIESVDLSRQTRMILNPSMRSERRSLVGTTENSELLAASIEVRCAEHVRRNGTGQVSLKFCLWVPCIHDWYESAAFARTVLE